MKVLTIYAAMGARVNDALGDQEFLDWKRITQAELCREIIDELLDRDLMGFLLSSAHLRRFLANYSTYAPPAQSQMIRRIILNTEVVDEIHIYLLRTYQGLHIKESRIPSRAELHAALDQKFELYACDLFTADIRIEVSLREHAKIENERRYRHACHIATTGR